MCVYKYAHTHMNACAYVHPTLILNLNVAHNDRLWAYLSQYPCYVAHTLASLCYVAHTLASPSVYVTIRLLEKSNIHAALSSTTSPTEHTRIINPIFQPISLCKHYAPLHL